MLHQPETRRQGNPEENMYSDCMVDEKVMKLSEIDKNLIAVSH
jgi:hypothetical protein